VADVDAKRCSAILQAERGIVVDSDVACHATLHETTRCHGELRSEIGISFECLGTVGLSWLQWKPVGPLVAAARPDAYV